MTVEELARLLARYPDDLRVVVDGYEDGYDDLFPEQLEAVRIRVDTGTSSFEGQHDDAGFLSPENLAAEEVVLAVVLRRRSN